MRLSVEDQRLLEDLCRQQGVSYEKVNQLLEVEQDFEFKERRTGVFDALRKILKTTPKNDQMRGV